jgi:hypothetical protein
MTNHFRIAFALLLAACQGGSFTVEDACVDDEECVQPADQCQRAKCFVEESGLGQCTNIPAPENLGCETPDDAPYGADLFIAASEPAGFFGTFETNELFADFILGIEDHEATAPLGSCAPRTPFPEAPDAFTPVGVVRIVRGGDVIVSIEPDTTGGYFGPIADGDLIVGVEHTIEVAGGPTIDPFTATFVPIPAPVVLGERTPGGQLSLGPTIQFEPIDGIVRFTFNVGTPNQTIDCRAFGADGQLTFPAETYDLLSTTGSGMSITVHNAHKVPFATADGTRSALITVETKANETYIRQP